LGRCDQVFIGCAIDDILPLAAIHGSRTPSRMAICMEDGEVRLMLLERSASKPGEELLHSKKRVDTSPNRF
jgi:hypothetical protein